MSRFAFSEPSIGSQTTRQRPPLPKTRSPSSSDTSEIPVELLEPPDDGRLGGRVDRGRVVAADAQPEHGSRSTRVGSSASTASMSPTAARQTSSHGVTAAAGAGR